MEVRVTTGEVWEGLLHSLKPEGGVGIVLYYAKKKDDAKNKSTRPIRILLIPPENFVQLTAKEVSFDSKITGKEKFRFSHRRIRHRHRN